MDKQLPLPFAAEPRFQDRKSRSVTFRGKFDYPTHRWFRLTPSFSPELVIDILDHWGVSSGSKVLDPFCGVGTTPLVCQMKGIESHAVEINPLLHFISQVKTTPLHDPKILCDLATSLVYRAESHFDVFLPIPTGRFLNDYAGWIPIIHNTTK